MSFLNKVSQTSIEALIEFKKKRVFGFSKVEPNRFVENDGKWKTIHDTFMG